MTCYYTVAGMSSCYTHTCSLRLEPQTGSYTAAGKAEQGWHLPELDALAVAGMTDLFGWTCSGAMAMHAVCRQTDGHISG